jgi:hypothetical protein
MSIVFCPECRNPTSNAAYECPACGFPLNSQVALLRAVTSHHPTHQRPASGLSLSGMICGMAGAALLFVPVIWLVAVVPATIGTILSAMSLATTPNQQAGWAPALTGLIAGAIGIALYAFLWYDMFRASYH